MTNEFRSDIAVKIADGLSQLKQSNGYGYMVVCNGDFYVQWAKSENETFNFEAVNDTYLPEDKYLNASQISRLLSLGFAINDVDNFAQEISIRSEFDCARFAQTAVSILFDIYKCQSTHVDFQLEIG